MIDSLPETLNIRIMSTEQYADNVAQVVYLEWQRF